tara:strand:- start:197 stop:652 length:456 start_codon:yes stop_codon:yes gene_type:complete
MARVVKPTVTRLQAQKAAAAKRKKKAAADKAAAATKKRYEDIPKWAGQAKPLSKETKRYAPPKAGASQTKASMQRHVIGATRAKLRKRFPELKTPRTTHDEWFEESTRLPLKGVRKRGSSGATRSALLKYPGRKASKLSKARYKKRKKTVS